MTRSPKSSALRAAGARGFTLIEVVISVVLMVVILQIVAGATLSMERSGRFGRKRTRITAQNQFLLQKVSNELRTCSMDTDPATGNPMFTITGVEGDRQISFRRVVTFGDTNGELVQVWSTPIAYRMEDSQIIRTQDDLDIILLRDVVWLEFAVDGLGRFIIEVGNSADSDETQASVVMQEVRVAPML